jgi:hypothetical protein
MASIQAKAEKKVKKIYYVVVSYLYVVRQTGQVELKSKPQFVLNY